jgi:excisionase family DNA binding protein
MTISTQTAQPATCSVPEAGQALGISRQSAYQAARTGELPTVKIGRRLLVPRRALETMLCIENDVALGGQSERAAADSAARVTQP